MAIVDDNKRFQDMLLSALCGDGMDDCLDTGSLARGDDGGGGGGGEAGLLERTHPMDDPIAPSTNMVLSSGVGANGGTGATEGAGVCLISGDPLEPRHVKLHCGHTFNYENIFNEVYRQKKVYQQYEKTILHMREIKCPYCRNVQDELLFEDARFPRVTGVNAPSRFCMYPAKCQFVLEGGDLCNDGCYETHCRFHLRLVAMMERLRNKQELKEQKASLKATKKAQAQGTKSSGLDSVVGSHVATESGAVIGTTTGCCAILKTGANKGLMCGARVKYADTGLCGRHGGNLVL